VQVLGFERREFWMLRIFRHEKRVKIKSACFDLKHEPKINISFEDWQG
jgi:hypothetical protein